MRSIASGKPYLVRTMALSPGAAQSALPGLQVHRRLRAVAWTDAQHRLRETISSADYGALPGGGAKRLARATGSSPSASGSPDRCAASPPGAISNAACGDLPGGGAKRLARATGSSPCASGSPDRCAASPPGNHIQCALWRTPRGRRKAPCPGYGPADCCIPVARLSAARAGGRPPSGAS